MKTAGVDRSLVVRMLLVCILFSLFACGLHHGQMSAADLLGAETAGANQQPAELEHHHGYDYGLHDQGLHGGGPFSGSAAEQAHPAGHAGHDNHQLTPAFSCPLCSSFGAVLAVNSRAWALPPLAREARSLPVARVEPQGPRHSPWNSLNPRAPPAGLARS